MNDKRTGRNIQHDMTNLLRQSVYSRLAGYEDVNDAQRLSVDPVMRAVGKRRQVCSQLDATFMQTIYLNSGKVMFVCTGL